jgi:transient-receptor-potential-like protein
MSYFEESATLPPPFNIFPAPKHFMKMLGLRKTDKMQRMSTRRKEKVEKDRDFRYTAVMRALVWRYVAAMQRKQDENPVTEDDINEIKSEITSAKCEILETLSRNGMNVADDATKDKSKIRNRNHINLISKLWFSHFSCPGQEDENLGEEADEGLPRGPSGRRRDLRRSPEGAPSRE